jgi:hypothetical protein
MSPSPHPNPLLPPLLGAILAALALAPAACDRAPQADGGDSSLQIRARSLSRDFGNARLFLEIHVDNRAGQTFTAAPPQLILVAGATPADFPEGAPDLEDLPDGARLVTPLTLPSSPPPMIPAGTRQNIELKFWLEPADLLGPLTLVSPQAATAVKDAAPLALEKLKDQAATRFRSPSWQP